MVCKNVYRRVSGACGGGLCGRSGHVWACTWVTASVLSNRCVSVSPSSKGSERPRRRANCSSDRAACTRSTTWFFQPVYRRLRVDCRGTWSRGTMGGTTGSPRGPASNAGGASILGLQNRGRWRRSCSCGRRPCPPTLDWTLGMRSGDSTLRGNASPVWASGSIYKGAGGSRRRFDARRSDGGRPVSDGVGSRSARHGERHAETRRGRSTARGSRRDERRAPISARTPRHSAPWGPRVPHPRRTWRRRPPAPSVCGDAHGGPTSAGELVRPRDSAAGRGQRESRPPRRRLTPCTRPHPSAPPAGT